MRHRAVRIVSRLTGSKMAAAFAADAFEALLLAGFSAKKLLRGSGNGEPLGDPESILTAIRPRSAPSFDCELVSAPDEVDASIIIPAYNAEAYLEECLDSAIAQVTNYRYEIVVVDDGSCDGTRRILCDYRDRHDLTVVRTANGGVAAARNTAIAVARGKYLLFLDSDDRLPADSVDLLISAAEREGADIVQGGHDVFDTSGRVIEQVRRAACTQSTLDENSTQISGYPWGKAVRRTMFRQVRFPDGMDFEDTIFALVILPLCGRYVSLRESVYNYRDNPSGVTQKVVGTPSALDAYWIVPVLLEQRGRLNLPVDENLLNRVQKQFGHLLWARVAGHDDRVRRAAFAAACGVVHNVRSQVVPTSNKPESPKLDFIFRERRYDLWSYAGKYGLL